MAGILQFDTGEIYIDGKSIRTQPLECKCTAAVYPLHLMQLLMLFLFVGSYVLLMALAGLFLGVKMPTLTWTNEIMPIKQGGIHHT